MLPRGARSPVVVVGGDRASKSKGEEVVWELYEKGKKGSKRMDRW